MLNFPSRHPYVWLSFSFVVGALPQWASAVWSLGSDEPLLVVIARQPWGQLLPQRSPFWVTVPLALIMASLALVRAGIFSRPSKAVQLFEHLEARRSGTADRIANFCQSAGFRVTRHFTSLEIHRRGVWVHGADSARRQEAVARLRSIGIDALIDDREERGPLQVIVGVEEDARESGRHLSVNVDERKSQVYGPRHAEGYRIQADVFLTLWNADTHQIPVTSVRLDLISVDGRTTECPFVSYLSEGSAEPHSELTVPPRDHTSVWARFYLVGAAIPPPEERHHIRLTVNALGQTTEPILLTADWKEAMKGTVSLFLETSSAMVTDSARDHRRGVSLTSEQGKSVRQESGPVMISGTTNANIRLELLKRILHEAATAARSAVEGQLDFSTKATTERAALHFILRRIVRELFSHRVIADFDAWDKSIDQKRELRNQSPDGKTHFLDMAQYFENLADRLEFEDIDVNTEEFTSFEQYRRIGPWSSRT